MEANLFSSQEQVLFNEALDNEVLRMVETDSGFLISHFTREVKTDDATLSKTFYKVSDKKRYLWRDNAVAICRAYAEGWRSKQQLSFRIGGLFLCE